MTSTDDGQALRAYILLIAMPLFFSSNIVIGRAALDTVEPYTLAFWRWFIAFLILLPFAYTRIRKNISPLRHLSRDILILGVLGMFICGAGVYVALRHTTATNGTLIYTTSPAMILLIEILFRGATARLRQIIGIVIAFIGVAVIVVRGDWHILTSLQFNIGDLGIVAAALSWAVYSVMLKNDRFSALPTMALFTAIAGAGALILFPFMIWELVSLEHLPVTAKQWTSIFGLAVIASVLPFTIYQFGVKVVGPAITGAFLYLLPVYGVTLSVLFLGETVHPYHGVGLVGVMIGVIMATWPQSGFRKRRKQA